MPADPSTSPLTEAAPNSLDELFSRDPLELSDQDIDQIVAHLRAQRKQWQIEEASGKKKSKASAPKERISLSDLDIKI